VIIFTSLLLYAQGDFSVPLDRKLGELQTQSGLSEEVTILDPTSTHALDTSVIQPIELLYQLEN
jgi:hypothetical protein